MNKIVGIIKTGEYIDQDIKILMGETVMDIKVLIGDKDITHKVTKVIIWIDTEASKNTIHLELLGGGTA